VSAPRRGAALALTSLLVVACGHRHKQDAAAPEPAPPSPIEARIAAAGKAFARYAPEDQALVRRGDFRVGLDELAVYIARGAPEIWWRTKQGEQTCNVLFYATGEAHAADLSVLTCGGTVTKRAPIAPAIPCWRLAEFAPRMVEQGAYFETLPLTRQWDLAIGALERGQTGTDVAIAYGPAYNSGSEAREDGTQATSLVFLDSAHEAYALHITLVDDKVVGWKIPAERVLTPQAQQRHAAAAARQAVEAVRAEEQQAAARYAEETQARNEAQSRKKLVIDTATSLAVVAASQAAASAPPPTVSATSSTKKSSSEKTLTLNGCTYHESGGGSLGQSCNGSCPASYICSVIGSGRSGFCVPQSQANACRGSSKKR
jgi:hypothetical protein